MAPRPTVRRPDGLNATVHKEISCKSRGYSLAVIFSLFFLSLFSLHVTAQNNPQASKDGIESVSLSQSEALPLPPGNWRLVWKDDYDFCFPTDTKCTGGEGRALVLRNDDPLSPIRGMIIRHTHRAVPNWSAKGCYGRDPEKVRMLDFHGTLENQLLNKCSYSYTYKRDRRKSEHHYWKAVRGGLDVLSLDNSPQADRFALSVLLQNSGKRFVLDIFVNRVGEDTSLDEAQISAWKALYVETAASSLFDKKLVKNRSSLALNYSWSKGGPKAEERLIGAETARVPLTVSNEVLSASKVESPSNLQIESDKPVSSAPTSPPPQQGRPNLDAGVGGMDTKVASLEAELARMREALEQLQAESSEKARESEAAAGSNMSAAPIKPNQSSRLALVIGNAKYKNVPTLDNSNKDAEAFASVLKGLGFKTSLHLDLSQRAFNKAVREFKDQLQGGEEVVVYFAGHGVQLASTNYLLPIDVGGDSADQVKDEAIELQRVLDSLSEKELQFSLAVIDACRDNPFKGAGRAIGGRGLAPTSAATGQMIIFSAGTGQQALDRLGPADKEPNGLFTRVFLKEMQKPGIPVDSMLRQVRKEVVRLAKSVGHEQVPALYDQTVGEFYFKVQ